ncbi:MAG: hypothetical protein M3076_06135 [Actinomycetota bacterium]|nr:hypothetical protein [Actinomycetota bacterium]
MAPADTVKIGGARAQLLDDAVVDRHLPLGIVDLDDARVGVGAASQGTNADPPGLPAPLRGGIKNPIEEGLDEWEHGRSFLTHAKPTSAC